MALLQEWRDIAYSQKTDKKQLQKFWTDYFLIEKGIYEKLLSNPDEVVKGTVKELAEKYEIPVLTMAGFLDGIDDSLKVKNPIDTMDENTEVTLAFDKSCCIRTWWTPRPTGCTTFPCGTRFSTRKRKRPFTVRQRRPTPLSRGRRSDATILARAEAGKKYKYCCGRNA